MFVQLSHSPSVVQVSENTDYLSRRHQRWQWVFTFLREEGRVVVGERKRCRVHLSETIEVTKTEEQV